MKKPCFWKKIAASSSQERNISNADASDLSTVEELKKLLIETGSELLKPCDSTEELLRKLHNLEHVLRRTTQDHKSLVALALQPSKEALIAKEIIRHAQRDVRVSVASCISEIIRITTPDEPYEDDHMKAWGSIQCSNLSRQGSSVKIAFEEISRGKSIAAEDLRIDSNVKVLHFVLKDKSSKNQLSSLSQALESYVADQQVGFIHQGGYRCLNLSMPSYSKNSRNAYQTHA